MSLIPRIRPIASFAKQSIIEKTPARFSLLQFPTFTSGDTTMFRHCVHFVVALSLVSATFLTAQRLTATPADAAPTVAVENAAAPVDADPTETRDELSLHTGDRFWGLYVGGVIPCSTMLVKGGGYLVMLAPNHDQKASCFFHVKEAKQIEFHGRRFRLEVVGQDQVRVVREAAQVASTS